MMAATRDRSSARLEASHAQEHHQEELQQQPGPGRRRTLKSSGSGSRRRRASVDRAASTMTSQESMSSLLGSNNNIGALARSGGGTMDSSAYSNASKVGSSRTRMTMTDNSSSAYSINNSGGGSSVRRQQQLQLIRHSSGLNLNNNRDGINAAAAPSRQPVQKHSRGHNTMDASAQSSTYVQKYTAAQELIERQHSRQQKQASPTQQQQQRTARRRTSAIGNIATGTSPTVPELEGENYPDERDNTPPSKSASTSAGKHQSQPQHQQHRGTSEKYKLISRVGSTSNSHKSSSGSRRQSMDSSATGDTSRTGDTSSRNNHHHHKRAVAPARTSSASARGENSITAMRLKKAFGSSTSSTNGDVVLKATPAVLTRTASRSPARGVRRQSSLPSHKAIPSATTPRRGGVERKPSGTGSLIVPNGSNLERVRSSRRSSMPSNAILFDDIIARQRRHTTTKQAPPMDRASRTTVNTPKTKPKAHMDADAMLDASMPSLAALDLSIHTNGTFNKRASDGSCFTMSTADDSEAKPPTRGRNSPPVGLQPAQSISLLFDNAQSHFVTHVLPNTNEEETVDEASTICNSVGDAYSGAANVNAIDRHDAKSLADISRSDATSNSQGMDGSGDRGSTCSHSNNNNSHVRRRTLSCDENENSVPRRVRSPKPAARSRSRSTAGRGETTRRNPSSRSLSRKHSTSSERKLQHQRRASIATARMPRNDSASSLPKDRDEVTIAVTGEKTTTSSSATTRPKCTALPGIQRSNTGESIPRRQKSNSSVKSAGPMKDASTKSAVSTRRKSKTEKTKNMLSESLSALDTVWARGPDAKGSIPKSKFQAAVNAVMASLEKENRAAPRSSASVLSSTSSNSKGSGSRRSGSSRKRPPRRALSVGSATFYALSGTTNKPREPCRRSSTDDRPVEPRSSDATWSLADIDLGADDNKDESVVTPATVTSSSAETLEAETPQKTKKGIIRSKSMNSKSGGIATGKDSRQQSQKSVSSAASRKEQKRQEAKENNSARGGSVDDTNLLTTASKTDPFHVDADEVDPFVPKQSYAVTKSDAFEGSGMDNPFGPVKRTSVESTKKKRSDDDLGPSFHMTNDFGDFGHESFGSISFDNSQERFAVVPGKKKSNSRLG